jgi:hypothetical protein
VRPGAGLRLLTTGGGPARVGQTRTSVRAVAPTPVTLRTTAVVPVGTPAVPTIWSRRTSPARSGPPTARVSRMRFGEPATSDEPVPEPL